MYKTYYRPHDLQRLNLYFMPQNQRKLWVIKLPNCFLNCFYATVIIMFIDATNNVIQTFPLMLSLDIYLIFTQNLQHFHCKVWQEHAHPIRVTFNFNRIKKLQSYPKVLSFVKLFY